MTQCITQRRWTNGVEIDPLVLACDVPGHDHGPTPAPISLLTPASFVCGAEWGYDVDFNVTCCLVAPHRRHRAVVEGNDSVMAMIEWLVLCPVCGEPNGVCERLCERPAAPHRPPPLPYILDRPEYDIEGGVCLPFWCWLRGHGRWRRSLQVGGGWFRRICPSCAHLDLPTPEARR